MAEDITINPLVGMNLHRNLHNGAHETNGDTQGNILHAHKNTILPSLSLTKNHEPSHTYYVLMFRILINNSDIISGIFNISQKYAFVLGFNNSDVWRLWDHNTPQVHVRRFIRRL